MNKLFCKTNVTPSDRLLGVYPMNKFFCTKQLLLRRKDSLNVILSYLSLSRNQSELPNRMEKR
jgi:hypothetical protein